MSRSSTVGPAVRQAARSELRRRWRALMVLGLLAGLAAGVAMAAAAGARRSDTAYERFLDETLAADAAVFASQQGIFNPDYEPIRQLPYVAAAGAFSIVFFPEEVCLFVPSDDWRDTVDRPLVTEGRLPDPNEPDEVLLAPPTSPEVDLGLGVGDTVTIHMFSTAQAELGDTSVEPEGPTATLEVVGIGSSSFETSTIPDTDGCLFGTRAFLDHYDQHGAVFHNLMVRLERGKEDIRRLESDVTKVLGTQVPIEDLSENVKRITNGTDLERSGLLLFAVAVAVTGMLVVGQALTRSVRAASRDVATLQALGLAPREALAVLVLPHVLAVVVAAVVSLVVAIALSPRLPIGLARSVDPDIGVHLDLLILLPGLLVLVLLLVGAVAVAATAVVRRRTPAGASRGSAVVSTLAAAGAPIATTVGAGLALESGRGPRALPTRPAVLGAVVGVAGVVGGLTLGAGIDDAVDHRERFGTVWDLEMADYSGGELPELVARLEADPDVAAVARVRRVNLPSGDASLPTYTIDARKGTLDLVVLSGRAPSELGEVVVGPATAKSFGIGIGDELPLGFHGERLEVVGTGLLQQSAHSQFDQGAWVSVEQGSALFDPELAGPFGDVVQTVADLGPGVDAAAKVAELQRDAPESAEITTPGLIADQEAMRGVRTLPVLFAVFTLVLAMGALAHVSTSVLRRRRGELAVLRALGVTPRQTWWCLSWQASILAVIGLVVGLPLGIAAGRVAWRSVAEATPMVYVAPLPLLAAALALPVTVLVANLIATGPGWRAARLRPAEVLRVE